MNTDELRLFVLTAETLNISAAGRVLDMAPAVASAKLAKLEKSLGAELFHRSTRRVSLSLEGAEFLPFATEILAQEDAGRAALGHGAREVRGTLRFAASSTFAQLHVMPELPGFLERHPGVNLELRLSDTTFDLLEGSFDLALRSTVLEDSSLRARKLADDIRVLCASPHYLATHGVPQQPDDLAAHQVIAFGSTRARTLHGPGGSTARFDPGACHCRLVVDDGLSQKLATLAGAGISMNSLWSVQQELDQGALVRVLPDHIVDERTGLWLIYPRSNVLTPKVRVFMDYLVETVGSKLSAAR